MARSLRGPLTASCSPARSANPNEWTVQFGELTSSPSFWSLRAYLHRYRVQDIVLYSERVMPSRNDIALLRLASSVTYSKHIQPVCILASSSEFQNQTDCWVTGWGDITEDEGEAGDRWIWGGDRGSRHGPLVPATPASAAPTWAVPWPGLHAPYTGFAPAAP